ncbi:phosphatidylinositol 5-phosphate 4-kinase type-2 gamma-like protein [Labeo rohita]|uniref:Phosphatidylinositol 5-phosphate 4-kinase type-2 gamma n=1 Tax=Labeo rohita TaxID=84645 RepID=A0A498M2G3_LABRO|nr:phosphatidylinositol 5-phosphate 4-kinase type-2 gamma-like protein [Labeo rohita]
MEEKSQAEPKSCRNQVTLMVLETEMKVQQPIAEVEPEYQKTEVELEHPRTETINHQPLKTLKRENLPGHFKFKEYCPLVFRNLRERFGVEHQDYLVSLTRSPPAKDDKSQEAGLVLTSYDRTLIVKQISSEEVEDMHNILSEYHQHIVTCHGSTLLPQFLGLYRVTVDNEDTYLLVMRNMFSHRLTIHRKYDLKNVG